jgi:hypothetical protein
MLQFCPWANKKEWMFLSAALILATAMASSCGDDQGGGTSLRAADVPVHLLAPIVLCALAPGLRKVELST